MLAPAHNHIHTTHTRQEVYVEDDKSSVSSGQGASVASSTRRLMGTEEEREMQYNALRTQVNLFSSPTITRA